MIAVPATVKCDVCGATGSADIRLDIRPNGKVRVDVQLPAGWYEREEVNREFLHYDCAACKPSWVRT